MWRERRRGRERAAGGEQVRRGCVTACSVVVGVTAGRGPCAAAGPRRSSRVVTTASCLTSYHQMLPVVPPTPAAAVIDVVPCRRLTSPPPARPRPAAVVSPLPAAAAPTGLSSGTWLLVCCPVIRR